MQVLRAVQDCGLGDGPARHGTGGGALSGDPEHLVLTQGDGHRHVVGGDSDHAPVLVLGRVFEHDLGRLVSGADPQFEEVGVLQAPLPQSAARSDCREQYVGRVGEAATA